MHNQARSIMRLSDTPIRFELHPRKAKINRLTGKPMKQESVSVYAGMDRALYVRLLQAQRRRARGRWAP